MISLDVLDDLAATREHLRERLRERAFQKRLVTLASGRRSNFYIDCKQVTLLGEGHLLIGRSMFDALETYEKTSGRRVGAIGGLTLGADPIASAVTMTAALRGRSLPAVIVRKEPKGHGTGAWLEGAGPLSEGAEVVVVEDVVTTGGSALKAVERLRAAGFVVRWVMGIVDRLEGGREAVEAAELELHTLFDRRDFVSDEELES